VEGVKRAVDAGLVEGHPLMVSIDLWVTVHGITSLLISKPGFPWPERRRLIDEVLRAPIFGVATAKARRRLS
jgi:hypothetical protein